VKLLELKSGPEAYLPLFRFPALAHQWWLRCPGRDREATRVRL